MVRAIPLGWPNLIGKCCSIFPLTSWSGIIEAPSVTPLMTSQANSYHSLLFTAVLPKMIYKDLPH